MADSDYVKQFMADKGHLNTEAKAAGRAYERDSTPAQRSAAVGANNGAGRGQIDERTARMNDAASVARDNIAERTRLRDLADTHATRTRDSYPMDKDATAAEQAAQKHLANVYESAAEDMSRRPDSFANGGMIGHGPAPKKPNPPFKPFGTKPDASPA